jgi:hypothetical protein
VVNLRERVVMSGSEPVRVADLTELSFWVGVCASSADAPAFRESPSTRTTRARDMIILQMAGDAKVDYCRACVQPNDAGGTRDGALLSS